jgi:hypothetical protein
MMKRTTGEITGAMPTCPTTSAHILIAITTYRIENEQITNLAGPRPAATQPLELPAPIREKMPVPGWVPRGLLELPTRK